MAILPVTVEREANNLLNNTWNNLNTNRNVSGSFLNRHRNSRFIEIDLTKKDCIRVPIYFSEKVSSLLVAYNRNVRFNSENPDNRRREISRVIVPLEIGQTMSIRSGDMLFRRAIEYRGREVIKFTTPNDGIFYGLPGIIFDSNFKPLICISHLIYLDEEHLEFSKDIKVYVDPSVVKSDNMITRFIYNKLIPFLMLESGKNIKLSIKEIDIITTPIVKNNIHTEDFTTEIPRLLKENYTDLSEDIFKRL